MAPSVTVVTTTTAVVDTAATTATTTTVGGPAPQPGAAAVGTPSGATGPVVDGDQVVDLSGQAGDLTGVPAENFTNWPTETVPYDPAYRPVPAPSTPPPLRAPSRPPATSSPGAHAPPG